MTAQIDKKQEQLISPPTKDNNKNQIVEIVRKWGDAASDAVLDPHCHYFQIPHIEGLIAYRNEKACNVIFGDPVCAKEDLQTLVKAFHQYSKNQGKSVIYVTATEEFANWSLQQELCKTCIEFGQELYLDPHQDPRERTGVNASLVRRKVRHALNDGVNAQEYTQEDKILEQQIDAVGDEWLKARKGPQVYISHVHSFENRMGKRWFYAIKDKKVVGLLILSQLKKHDGWLLNRLMYTPDAPHGTQELLVVTALEALKHEGCHYVTVGSIPSDELGDIQGLSSFSTWITRKAYLAARKIFKLEGRRKFWDKFHPENKRSYLLFSDPSLSIGNIRGLMKAMNVSF